MSKITKFTNALTTAIAYVVFIVIMGVIGAAAGVVSAFLWNGLMLLSPIDWSVEIVTTAMMFAGLTMISGSCVIMAHKNTEVA